MRRAQPGEAAAGDLSELLHAWSEGDRKALERLIPIVYEELHRGANRHMRRERAGHSLPDRRGVEASRFAANARLEAG
jgi:hypothetical protein